jgi:hypothetical protein
MIFNTATLHATAQRAAAPRYTPPHHATQRNKE